MNARVPRSGELAVLLAAVGLASAGHYVVMQALGRLGVTVPSSAALSASLGGLAALFVVGLGLAAVLGPRLPGGTYGGRRP